MKVPTHGDVSSVGHGSILASKLPAMSFFLLPVFSLLCGKGLLCADVGQVVQEQLVGVLGGEVRHGRQRESDL